MVQDSRRVADGQAEWGRGRGRGGREVGRGEGSCRAPGKSRASRGLCASRHCGSVSSNTEAQTLQEARTSQGSPQRAQ